MGGWKRARGAAPCRCMKTNPISPAPRRKGSLRMADIPAEVRQGLNEGRLEAVTLVEALAVDHARLLREVLPQAGEAMVRRVQEAQQLKITGKMRAMGEILHEGEGLEVFETLARHRSDTVRGWAASLLGAAAGLTLRQRLLKMADLADDPNPGVREWAWMALRPHLIEDLERGMQVLAAWVRHESACIRRFASEITRPRGVWCAHIELLKQEPWRALSLLEPLHEDPARYVQNSVANWLNDAAKSRPDFTRETCARWRGQSGSKATAYIVKRAMRSL